MCGENSINTSLFALQTKQYTSTEKNMADNQMVITIRIVVIAVCLVVFGSATDGTVPCSNVVSKLTPCLPYLIKYEVQPEMSCCYGVEDVSKYANDKNGREGICECVKAAVISVGPIFDWSLIASLPQNCGLSVPMPSISPTIDCTK